MRSALKLIAFSLVLTGCTQQLAQPPIEQPEVDEPIENIVTMQSVQAEFNELIDCSESFAVTEGEFQTVVCNQGVIRFWDEPITDDQLAPWLIWCQPAMAAGSEPSFEVLFSENFIIQNNNPETIGQHNSADLCDEISNREFSAFEAESESSYGLLINLAQSGLCMSPPSISETVPLRHVCAGFGLDEQDFTLWLETGEIETLVNEYSAECGAGISGTYGSDWLMTTYDLEVVVSGERLDELLSLVSPVPFSNLCDAEKAS